MLTDQQVIELVQRTDPVPNVEHLPGPRHDALTLLAEADPHVPPRPKACGELLAIERSEAMDTQERPTDQDTARRTGWRTAAIAFAAIIVVVGAGIGIAALIAGDDDTAASPETLQTLTFDGETLTYRGPETLQAGTVITVTLENTSEEAVQYNWGRLRDPDMTLEEYKAAVDADENVLSDGQSIEAWRSGVPAQSVETAEYRLSVEGTYVLSAAVPSFDEQGLTSWDRYPAVLIEVAGD